MGVYRDAAIYNCEKQIKENPDLHNKIIETHREFMKGECDYRFVDIIMQKHQRSPFDIYDIWTYFQIYAAIAMGKVLFCSIGIGKCPESDSEIKKNNAILSEMLWHPFRAEFIPSTGRGYNDDGTFYWDEKIEFGATSNDSIYETTVEAFHAPLEVGYTNPETTLMHLKEQGFLARWPYNHDIIYLLYRDDRKLWQFPWEEIEPIEQATQTFDNRTGRIQGPIGILKGVQLSFDFEEMS